MDENVPQIVLGYFTLAMASVPREAFPRNYVRGLQPYALPLILLAWLAVGEAVEARSQRMFLDLRTIRTALRDPLK